MNGSYGDFFFLNRLRGGQRVEKLQFALVDFLNRLWSGEPPAINRANS